jgi:hypothetical protein
VEVPTSLDRDDELMQFAAETWPEYKQLPKCRSIPLPRSIGPKAMHYFQSISLSAVIDKGRNRLSWRRDGT